MRLDLCPQSAWMVSSEYQNLDFVQANLHTTVNLPSGGLFQVNRTVFQNFCQCAPCGTAQHCAPADNFFLEVFTSVIGG